MDNKIQTNKVKNRFLFISPSVQLGLESEAKIADFDVIEKIGEGSFGKVYRAKHKKTGAIYAIKSIDKLNKNNQEGKPYFRREIEIMYKVHHPNIVRLFNHFEDDQNCYFVLDYIPKGNLYTILSKQKTKSFDATTVAHFIKDLICSIYYLHNMDPPIIHRDIKPENVLLSENNKIKLTDFGWSNYIEDTSVRSTYCGTPVYLAPEMIKETGHGESLDIWCIGILMFELLTGNIPFQANDQQTLNANILKNKICWPKDMDLSAKDLISKILKTDPAERISHTDMLKHPFFVKHVDKVNENFFKPSESSDDKSVYVLSRDTPQLAQKDVNNRKKDQVSTNDGSSTAANSNITSITGSASANPNLKEIGCAVILQDEKENYNKLILEHNKLLKDYANLKEAYNEVFKKNEDLAMKQNYFNLEKKQLIKERDEIEDEKLEYQKHISEVKQSIFEFENKIRIMKNELKIKETKIELDNKEIDRLNNEIDEIILDREEDRKNFNNKLESLEKKLAQSIDQRESYLNGEISDIRSSLKVVYDETENCFNSPFRDSTLINDKEEMLRKANDELVLRLESIKNEFVKEKEKFSLLLKNKDEEIKRLANEKNSKKESESRKVEMIANKYENNLKSKDAEIENLKARMKKLENIISINEMKK
jgi:serine/threonine protein kinase